jgi:hypothetical protein
MEAFFLEHLIPLIIGLLAALPLAADGGWLGWLLVGPIGVWLIWRMAARTRYEE